MSSLEPLKTMRRGGSRMCASVPHAFHQHLHQSPCVVCESAEAALISGAKDAASASLGSSLINAPSSNSVPSKRAANAAARPTCASSRPTSSLSLVELRRDALLRWLQTFSDEERLHGVPGSSGANSDGGRTLTSGEAFDACYSAYLTSDDPQAQKDLFHTLLETLDQQCSRTGESFTRSTSNSTRGARRERRRCFDIGDAFAVHQQEQQQNTSKRL